MANASNPPPVEAKFPSLDTLVGPFHPIMRPHREGVYLRVYDDKTIGPNYSRWDGMIWRTAVSKVDMAGSMRLRSVWQMSGFVWYGVPKQ